MEKRRIRKILSLKPRMRENKLNVPLAHPEIRKEIPHIFLKRVQMYSCQHCFRGTWEVIWQILPPASWMAVLFRLEGKSPSYIWEESENRQEACTKEPIQLAGVPISAPRATYLQGFYVNRTCM